MIGKSMMEASTDVDRDSVIQGVIGSQHRTSSGQPERAHQFWRVGNLHLEFFARGQRSRFQFENVLWRMHQQNVPVRGRLRRHEVGRLGYATVHELLVNAAVLFRGENVGSDRKVVVLAVDELEGKHSVFSRRKPTIIRARREIGSSGTARPARQIPRDLPVG